MSVKAFLKRENEDLRNRLATAESAIRILYAGTLQGHSLHWDADGTHGRNCPACKFAARQRDAAVKILDRIPECDYIPEKETADE